MWLLLNIDFLPKEYSYCAVIIFPPDEMPAELVCEKS
jgi:hypothetical protein